MANRHFGKIEDVSKHLRWQRITPNGVELIECWPRKSDFGCKSLILHRITALPRFAEPFQNLSNHFKGTRKRCTTQRAAVRGCGALPTPARTLWMQTPGRSSGGRTGKTTRAGFTLTWAGPPTSGRSLRE